MKKTYMCVSKIYFSSICTRSKNEERKRERVPEGNFSSMTFMDALAHICTRIYGVKRDKNLLRFDAYTAAHANILYA